MSFVSYAQNFEDVMLWRALKHIEHGFYVDVGAQHPIIDSVSLAFYEHGWRGVHIEPVSSYANLLREQRPDEIVIQAAIGAKKGIMTFFELLETGLSTADRKIADRHKEEGFAVNEVNLPCLTLTEALSLFSGREIHWLKIDVEGYERQVLEGWGSEIKPWVVVIESTLPLRQTESYREWEHLIVGFGYKFVYFDGLNRFFVSHEHSDLQNAFRCGPNVFDDFTLSGTASNSFCKNLNAKVEKELTQFSGRLQLLESELTQSRAQRDLLYEGLETTRQHAARIEGELAQFKNAVAQLENRLGAREAELNRLYCSRSWRMTKPLRQINFLIKRSACMARNGISALANFPRRITRRVLLSALEYIQTRPELKVKVARLFARFPRLNTRLRVFVWANNGRSSIIVSQSALDPLLASLADLSGVEVRWERLSPSVRSAYQKLIQARACAHAFSPREQKTENVE